MIRRCTRCAIRSTTPALLTAILIAAGCNSQPRVSDRDLTYIEDSALVEAIGKQDRKKPLVVVDARPPARFDIAHIPGAVNIPLQDAVSNDSRLTVARMIVVYALDWEDPIALAMSKKLLALGYSNVHTYRGGLREWITRGRPTDPPIELPPAEGN